MRVPAWRHAVSPMRPWPPRPTASSQGPTSTSAATGDHVIVEVQRSLAPPGPLGRWGSVHLRAQAEALVESAP